MAMKYVLKMTEGIAIDASLMSELVKWIGKRYAYFFLQ
jgi:hypothetical protein